MSSIPTLTRRRLLASGGVVGLVGFTGRTASVTERTPDYTSFTHAEPDDGGLRLQVAWYSTYNGALLDASREEPTGDGRLDVDGYAPDADGPLLDVDDVLPGDRGTIGIGLLAEGADARVRLVPEVAGRLADVVDLELWYDRGPFGVGSCSGTGSRPRSPAIQSTLAAFATEYGPGTGGLALSPGLGRCLPEGNRRCLGIAWSIDDSVGNAYQGSALECSFRFVAESCGGLP